MFKLKISLEMEMEMEKGSNGTVLSRKILKPSVWFRERVTNPSDG